MSGDTRSDKEVRKDRADDRKAFDRQRKDWNIEERQKMKLRRI